MLEGRYGCGIVRNIAVVNISLFDRENLNKVFGAYIYPDGTTIDIEYIMHIQELFGEWFAKGDPASGLPYRFPVVTLNISKDENGKIIDQDFLKWASRANLPKGCFNIYVNDGHKIASCCRLVNDTERMQYRQDSFGNGGLNIGSHRVVTVNLPRVALKANGDKELFKKELEKALVVTKDLLVVHREELLQRRIDQGFMKFFNPLKWFTLRHLFSTIGIVGVYEMVHFMGLDIRTQEGQDFAKETLLLIEEYAKKFSKETGNSFNVEEIPGESTAPRFVSKDRLLFGEEAVPFELYSNQYIPLIANATMAERVKITGLFMDILSGGGILHLNVKDQLEDPEMMEKLVLYCVANGVSHFAINYGFGTCVNGHTTVAGNSKTCSVCGDSIQEWMTRIIGYFTKTSSWNKVRREFEFGNRQFFNIGS